MNIFKRVIGSIKARIVIPYMIKNFEKTKYGKEIVKLKDSHKGETCFVIGNGPSLSAKDLDVLSKNSIVTFGTNRVYKIFDQTDWRPTYYVSEDANILRGIQREISELKCDKKFIPINLKWYENINITGATYFNMTYNCDYSNNFGLAYDFAHSVPCRSTVSITCLQLAIYMGFSEIYLIGVDHNFAKMIDKDGNVIVDNTIQSNFVKDYQSDVPDLGFSIDEATQSYLDIECLSKRLGTVRVFNATRGGKLEVFERVDFDKLFNL